ncbi:hypothetical protein BM1_06126 [Bipolaris maydis]|nr:hypothetical protein BM1_06126 [Bipolaris maydis]
MATQQNHVDGTPNDCAICLSKGELRCTRCQSISYCSKRCQKADSQCHQLLCTKFTQQSARPSLQHRLGLEFPDSGAGPRFIWIHCEAKYDEDEETVYQVPHVKPYFEHASGSSYPMPRLIRRNLRLDRSLRDAIEITSRDAFLLDGSVHNPAVYMAASFGGVGDVPVNWMGPIVVLRVKGCSIDPNEYLDITMDDFRCVMDYFCNIRD